MSILVVALIALLIGSHIGWVYVAWKIQTYWFCEYFSLNLGMDDARLSLNLHTLEKREKEV